MSDFDKELLVELGKATRELRKQVSQKIDIGVDIKELINFLEVEIFSRGYLPSFPAMVSVNDMAAHYTVFDEGYVLKKGDVIKVDFGLSKNGFLTDNAFTHEVGSNNHKDLIDTAKACLDAAIERAEAGTKMQDIGECVFEVARQRGFNTIHNLSGHQIGQNALHYGLSVPNLNNGDTQEVPQTSQFAIEPFVTYGEPRIKSCRLSNIVHLRQYKPVRDPIAMKVLKHIKTHFEHLPFSKRWLVQEVLDEDLQGKTGLVGFDKRKVLYAVSILKKYGVLYEYDELGTVDGEIVAQFEDCVLFVDGEKTIITRQR